MSHVMQAIKIKKMLNRLSHAKETAMRELLGLPPRTSWFEDCTTSVMTCIKDKCCQIFFPCCLYDRNRRWKRLSCWDSPVFKDFIGFLGGVLFSLLLFLVLVFQMDVPPLVSFITCAVASLVLTGVMAFSDTVRCVVLLMIPQFFSGKGRMLLLMYALFLAINTPLQNMSDNIGVMSQSTTCGQEMALNGTKELVKAAKAPIQSVIDSVEEVVQKLKKFSNGLRDMYVALENSVGKIAGTIKEALEWMMNMVKKCNDKMGAPYQKCMHMFHTAKESCRDALIWPLKELCDVVDLVDELCKIVRTAIRAMEDAREMFYFNATISYKFNYTFVQSKSYGDIGRDIVREISGRLDTFKGFISITKNIMTFAILLVVTTALVYRYKWLTDDRYDNMYITFTLQDLDMRRKEKNRLGIMPLTFDEELRYVSSVSAIMIQKERKKLVVGLIIFILSFFNGCFYMFCDFGLYVVLRIVEKHFSVESKIPIPPHTKLHVGGEGPMADMYRSIVAMFDPLSSNNVKVDITPCVPHPHEPNWFIYKVIGWIYFICLILTITEAYGLRLRHIIMACYFPRRERKRAIWLYNHILKTRGPILDAARSSLKKRHAGELDADHISLKGRLAASYPIFEKIFKWFGWEVKSCLYCGREGKPDDYFNFVHCAYYDCDAVYCLECFADLDNVCPVCMKSVKIKGTGTSEEVDSSLDERGKMMSEAQKQSKEVRIKNIKAERRPSKRLADIREKMGMQFGTTAANDGDLTGTSEGGSSTSTDSSPDSDSSTVSDDSDDEDSDDDDESDDSADDQSGQRINNSSREIDYSPETGRRGSYRSYTGRGSSNHGQIGRGTNNSSRGLWKHRSNYNNHNSNGNWYGRNLSNNANYAKNTMNVADSDSSDAESSEISDCSSVRTEDLDFSYQYVKNLDIDEVSDDADYVLRKQKKGLDLVPDDAFDSLESDSDGSDSVIFAEPRNDLVFRI